MVLSEPLENIERRRIYLDIIVIGTVDVEHDAALVTPGRRVAAHDALAEADAPIGHDERKRRSARR